MSFDFDTLLSTSIECMLSFPVGCGRINQVYSLVSPWTLCMDCWFMVHASYSLCSFILCHIITNPTWQIISMMTSSVLEMPKIDDSIQVYRSEVNATVSKVTAFTLSIFQQDCGYPRVYCHKLMNQLDELNYQNWGQVLPRQLKKIIGC